MKVLSVNKFYYLKGGSETYYFNLNRLLEQNGIDVVPFSMKDDRNNATEYDRYFVENIDYSRPGKWDKIRYSARIIYSFDAKSKIGKIVEDTKPDLAHLHVFQHQLSPSILKELKNHGVPIVNTVHDLKPLCPNYKMLSHHTICEKCRDHKYYQCLINRCIKNSRLGSLVNTTEMYLHWLLDSYGLVDAYITPCRFFRNKFIEYGYPPEKLVHIPNFVYASSYIPNYSSENYFLYFGRLSEEKGVLTLLQAMKKVKGLDLYIAGDGPLEDRIKAFIQENRLSNVTCFGYRKGMELQDLIRNSKFTVLPSEVYENSPLSVLEAMACGKPVIGSNIGGIPELILNRKTGLVFAPGNAVELAECINTLAGLPGRIREMGEEARNRVETKYNERIHFEKISEVYNRLLTGRRESYGRADRSNVQV